MAESQDRDIARSKGRILRRWVGLLAVIVLGCCIWFVYDVIAIGDSAERQLMSVHCARGVLIRFMQDHEGRWPSSWAELEREVPPSAKYQNTENSFEMGWRWPQDIGEIQKFVSIDFHADPVVLAKQSPDEFHAIKTNEKEYYEYRGEYALILEAIQKLQQAKHPATQSGSSSRNAG